MTVYSHSVVKVGQESRVAELHRVIDDAEARVRLIQQEGTDRANERARYEWELGRGQSVSEPAPSSLLAQLGAIRPGLARSGGAPRISETEAKLARRREIVESAITALSVRQPDMARRMADAEHALTVLRDELLSLQVQVVDMSQASTPRAATP